ncbi:filaggrin-like [Eriocheir sinensis]|uniref:filaggrin-like n=1 Tax=Eriocheir sinensis TaxID=95602 RepID=UPI0021CA6C0B|nr:filaggrin-like [Eriocheir sinensis]
MLPHFPALLLLLVSSGGSDLSHSPPPPWKLPAPSRPSPPPPPAGPPQRGHGADTLTSSTPEIKVRSEVLSDAADHLPRPSGGHRDASPAGSSGAVAREGPLALHQSRMTSHQPAYQSPTAELSTRSRARPGPSGDVNTWVIRAASRAEPRHANHRLAPLKPSINDARGGLPRDAPENASYLNTDAPGRWSQPHALMESSHQGASPPLPVLSAPVAHDVNSRHNYFTTSAARDSAPSGQPSLNEITTKGSSGRGGREQGHITAAATQRQRIRLNGDVTDAKTHSSRSSGRTQDSWTEEDHTTQNNASAKSVRSLDAVQMRREIGGVENGKDEPEEGETREEARREGEEGIDLSRSSPASSAPLPPQRTGPRIPSVLRDQTRHSPIILMSDNPGGASVAKTEPSSIVFGREGNSVEEVAGAALSKTWRSGSERQRTPVTVQGAASSNKTAKNSLFKVDRAGKEAGVRGSSPRSAQREKREPEETGKNGFVVVGAEAAGGHWDMAEGQGQGAGTGRRTEARERRMTGEAGHFEDGRRKKTMQGHYSERLNPSVITVLEGQPPVTLEEGEEAPQKGRRRRVKRWSSVQESYNNLEPDMYSRVFPGSYPFVYSSYNPAEALQGGSQGGAEDSHALLPRGSQDTRFERKSRASGVHAGRSSARVKGVNKHARGERGYTKTPQQRHARSRNRAKRKGECSFPCYLF